MVNIFAKHSPKLLLVLLYIVVFIYLIFPYSDYDWGWHFRYGEYFFKHWSLLQNDIYSWTMPGYAWVNHSWLYDLVVYLVFSLGEFHLMMILGALVGFLTYYIIVKSFKLFLWQKTILALFFIKLVSVVMMQSLRSQVMTLIFYPLLLLIFLSLKKNFRHIFFLPPLFLVWANLHGTFTIGLLITIIYFVFYYCFNFKSEKKKTLTYLLVVMGILIATLLTPNGFWTYFEAIKHLSGPYLANIYEWRPFFVQVTDSRRYFLISYLLFLLFLFLYRRKLSDLSFGVILLILAFLSLKNLRYSGPFIATSLPVLALFLEEVKWSLEKYKVLNLLILISLVVSLEIGLFKRLPEYNFFHYSFSDYCQYSSRCSEKLTEYLLKNPPQGKGFNFYDWGGYLIGKGIKTKLFIDGRMHLWERGGYMPFADYIKMYYQRDYQIFNSYRFDWVLVRNDSPLARETLLRTEVQPDPCRDGVTAGFLREHGQLHPA